ncbi:hypothetical protein [Brevibacillus marinus]|uniref:hypothetical protein n=1 Tax=Brevibacillus marinus TaxID=2496837 RepID=UPI000F845FA2|nr:hypothetical protein [Brevibacillus marinus]
MSQTQKNSWKWIVLTVLIGAGIGYVSWFWPPVHVESMKTADGIRLKFRTQGEELQIYHDQTWKPFFVKGVNLGASLPGHYPGELPLSKEDYLRWFAMIDELGANVIRVYTIHAPVFYEALVEYNQQKQGDPLYLMQGIWSPEEKLIEKKDAYLPDIREEFRREIAHAVRAVYGDITIPEQPGKASGTYRANAGPYLIGWHIGTEWDPLMVQRTNQLHPDASLTGIHFQATAEATPFEKWLAEMVDYTAQQEIQYGWQHPLTFTNWVTTDPLSHPGEPLYHEDMVSVDPTHIQAVNWDAGYFAAYHVYPYYPDLFRRDPSLRQVKNESGEIDTYKAYLRQLKAHHSGMPIMVTEFGVPASLGVAHIGNLGRDQGGHSEQQQGEINAELFREIYAEGYAGAILFAWQDEWFKKTWNTMKFELPQDRLAYWLNVLTNESLFGVLGMYPGKDGRLIIDGDASDWDKLTAEEKKRLDLPVPGWQEIWMTHDEGYVYILARLEKAFDPSKETLYLGFDTIAGGNRHAAELGRHKLDEGLETLLQLGLDEESEIRIAANYDFHTRLYGVRYRMFPVNPAELRDDSGVFKPWKLAVSLAMEPPDSKQYYPLEDVVVGHFQRGTTNANDPAYNSLALWQYKGNVVELRIPWMLLGFTDPSSLQVMSYQDDGKAFETVTTAGIRLLPWIVERQSQQVLGLAAQEEAYPVSRLPRYTWAAWETVHYQERKKQSYYIVQKAYREIDPYASRQ